MMPCRLVNCYKLFTGALVFPSSHTHPQKLSWRWR